MGGKRVSCSLKDVRQHLKFHCWKMLSNPANMDLKTSIVTILTFFLMFKIVLLKDANLQSMMMMNILMLDWVSNKIGKMTMNQLKRNKFKVEHILINFMATFNPEYKNDEQ